LPTKLTPSGKDNIIIPKGKISVSLTNHIIAQLPVTDWQVGDYLSQEYFVSDQTKRPNILFIMSDDHASHAISAYGSRINQTPNIDRIAEDGMRFNNCFCTNSICTPSRATILTGTH